MKLLEIVKGEVTSPKALAMGYAVAKCLGKIPVVAGVCDGFIGNRILARYREAADTLLMDGCTPWDIDAAMVDFGYAMGPHGITKINHRRVNVPWCAAIHEQGISCFSVAC